MGEFINAVRKSRIISPLRSQFQLKNWFGVATSTATRDSDDLELVASGVFFNDKLQRLWTNYSALHLERFPRKQLRRAYVGTINRDLATMRGKIDARLEGYKGRGVLHMEELLTTTIGGVLNGNEYAPDDIAAAGVDGLHMPLRKTFDAKSDGAGKLAIEDIGMAVKLGQLHYFLSSVWDDCLWLNHHMHRKDGVMIVTPTNKTESFARAVGYARMVARQSEMMFRATSIWQSMNSFAREVAMTNRFGVQINGSGSRTVLTLVPAKADSKHPAASFLIRLIASELYFAGLFETELPKIPGVTPSLLLSAWELLHELADTMMKDLPNESDIKQPSELWKFAPILPVRQLSLLLKNGLNIPFHTARSIIEFLTFTAEQSDELWVRPFVKIDDDTVVPVLVCLHDPNPIRMVERWMKHGGVNLDPRGEAYEVRVRADIAEALKHSRLLKESGVHPTRYKLPIVSGDNPGDIDIIIWFGDTMLIGELKCTLFPTRSSEIYNYLSTLKKASVQVSRKASAFQNGIDRFWTDIVGRPQPVKTQIIPIVITSVPLGVGLQFDGVPVTDTLILERFLGDGYLDRRVILDDFVNPTVGERVSFYTTSDEAESVISDYLVDPPQLRHFRDGISTVHNVIPNLDTTDEQWVVFDHSVKITEAILNSPNILTDPNLAKLDVR